MTSVWVEFANCELSLDRRELKRDGEPVRVEPQVFDVLAYLVTNRDRVVPKHELLDEVWRTRFVTESALTSRIKSARRAVGDTGRDQRVIRTVHARGYRFVAEVEPVRVEPGGSGLGAVVGAAGSELVLRAVEALTAGDRPSGHAVEIDGGAGAGKSDLLDHAADASLAAGLIVGRGGPGGLGESPLSCVVDAVDELVQRRPELLDAVPAGCRDELERVFAGHEPRTRQRLRVAVREVTVAAAAAGGAVLLFDDVHLAGDEALAVLAELARLTRRHRLLVAAAHRPGRRLGPPFTLVELADGEVDDGAPEARLAADDRDALRLVALAGARFDFVDARAATGLDDAALHPLLKAGAEARVLEAAGGGYRFVAADIAERLVAELPGHAQAPARQRMASRLADAGAGPSRVAAQLLAAGDPTAAAPHALDAARRAAATQFHSEVLRWTDAARGHLDGPDEAHRLSLRADALTAAGDPSAVAAYREALDVAPAAERPGVRARLARAAILSGDLASAEEALHGLEPDGGPDDAAILLATGMLAYFTGDLDRADAAVERLRARALAPGAPDRLLDVITLQGMVAHSRGEWFDRLRHEMRATSDNPRLAAAVFDSHLCVAESLLYGPTPYAEVVTLAHDLRRQAERTGARRAVAFSVSVAGEAALLAGDLDTARRDLTEALELHRQSGGETGVAHAMQRLAEVELAAGDRDEADRLLRRALPLARWSPLARHLLQRIYGTLISAAPDLDAAMAVVSEAVATMDEPTACPSCQVMIAAPAAIACAEADHLDEARAFVAQAEASAALWQGTAWLAAVAEARAALARAEGDEDEADRLLAEAVALFDVAGQPLDAERCAEQRRG
jgi:DNA-binding winged helix-turn-helix (wHTH) protein/tetratricopeptide (TPR) repeat protein